MRTVGVIGAMESEVTDLIARMEGVQTQHIAGRDFAVGKLSGVDAVVVQSGIGKVAAAATAQLLIDRFGVHMLINTGMGGGLDSRLAVKDLVVATGAVQHDFDLTAFGHAPGYIRGEDDSRPTVFACDGELVQMALEAAGRVLPAGSKAITGTVASGDVFVDDSTVKRRIIRQFSAAVTEMEGGAIAQVAADNGVPFLILRTVSDMAEHQANVSFEELEIYAGRLAGDITAAVLAALQRKA